MSVGMKRSKSCYYRTKYPQQCPCTDTLSAAITTTNAKYNPKRKLWAPKLCSSRSRKTMNARNKKRRSRHTVAQALLWRLSLLFASLSLFSICGFRFYCHILSMLSRFMLVFAIALCVCVICFGSVFHYRETDGFALSLPFNETHTHTHTEREEKGKHTKSPSFLLLNYIKQWQTVLFIIDIIKRHNGVLCVCWDKIDTDGHSPSSRNALGALIKRSIVMLMMWICKLISVCLFNLWLFFSSAVHRTESYTELKIKIHQAFGTHS